MLKVDPTNKTITLTGNMSITSVIETLQLFNREGWSIQPIKPGTEPEESHYDKPVMPPLDPTGDQVETLKS